MQWRILHGYKWFGCRVQMAVCICWSSDPVRVLGLIHNNYSGYSWYLFIVNTMHVYNLSKTKLVGWLNSTGVLTLWALSCVLCVPLHCTVQSLYVCACSKYHWMTVPGAWLGICRWPLVGLLTSKYLLGTIQYNLIDAMLFWELKMRCKKDCFCNVT